MSHAASGRVALVCLKAKDLELVKIVLLPSLVHVVARLLVDEPQELLPPGERSGPCSSHNSLLLLLRIRLVLHACEAGVLGAISHFYRKSQFSPLFLLLLQAEHELTPAVQEFCEAPTPALLWLREMAKAAASDHRLLLGLPQAPKQRGRGHLRAQESVPARR